MNHLHGSSFSQKPGITLTQLTFLKTFLFFDEHFSWVNFFSEAGNHSNTINISEAFTVYILGQYSNTISGEKCNNNMVPSKNNLVFNISGNICHQLLQ